MLQSSRMTHLRVLFGSISLVPDRSRPRNLKASVLYSPPNFFATLLLQGHRTLSAQTIPFYHPHFSSSTEDITTRVLDPATKNTASKQLVCREHQEVCPLVLFYNSGSHTTCPAVQQPSEVSDSLVVDLSLRKRK